MKCIITKERFNYFSEKDAIIIRLELSDFYVEKKLISNNFVGLKDKFYVIFIEIETEKELRSVLNKCGIEKIKNFMYYEDKTYPEIILREEVINEFRLRYNTL